MVPLILNMAPSFLTFSIFWMEVCLTVPKTENKMRKRKNVLCPITLLTVSFQKVLFLINSFAHVQDESCGDFPLPSIQFLLPVPIPIPAGDLGLISCYIHPGPWWGSSLVAFYFPFLMLKINKKVIQTFWPLYTFLFF